MTRKQAVRRLFWLAEYERNNRCPTCGRQKEHICSWVCVDVCKACEWGFYEPPADDFPAHLFLGGGGDGRRLGSPKR